MLETITITYNPESTKGTFMALCAKAWDERNCKSFVQEAKKTREALINKLKANLKDETTTNNPYKYNQTLRQFIRGFGKIYPLVRQMTDNEDLTKLKDKELEKALTVLQLTSNTLADFCVKNQQKIEYWVNNKLPNNSKPPEGLTKSRKSKELFEAIHKTKEPFFKNEQKEKRIIIAINNLIRETLPQTSIFYVEKKRKRIYYYSTNLYESLYEEIYKTVQTFLKENGGMKA